MIKLFRETNLKRSKGGEKKQNYNFRNSFMKKISKGIRGRQKTEKRRNSTEWKGNLKKEKVGKG